MKRKINKVAVLGSGAMGSQIAAHFANIGVNVVLLDIVPNELSDKEKKKGKTLEDTEVRNRIVNDNLKETIKRNPSPFYLNENKDRITTGNFDDDLDKIADADWILEAIIEKEDIKKGLYEKVEKHRADGTIVSSNTSGIPINKLIEGRSDDFQQHFLGTHFFNPPRYLELLEIIPTKKTNQNLTEFLANYGDVYLGKTTIVCKDTPAFIGNRIGVYSIMLTIQLMQDIGLSIEEVDALTGKFVGRPKTATFRTSDLVGIDILADVAQGVYDNCPDDEEREVFKIPDFLQQMLDNGWLGQKSGQGFYKKVKDDNGESKILALDIETMEYEKSDKPKFGILEEVKHHEDTEDKLESFEQGNLTTVNFFKKMYLKIFGNDDDKAVQFFREFYYSLFAYCSHCIPEITDKFYKIDRAIKAGFNWEFGPFEIWDILGFEETCKQMEEAGYQPAEWVQNMRKKGITSFYQTDNDHRVYYDIDSDRYEPLSDTQELIYLDDYRKSNTVFSNDECNIIDINDGVLNVEFTSKSNAIGFDTMKGINKAIDMAEDEQTEYTCVVIGNEGKDFSLGANLGMIAINAFKGKTDIVEKAVTEFQDTVLRIKYSSIPVISAIHDKTLGGGAEIAMYSDGVQAAAETYIGLVEVGAGLIPAGGGTTEFTRRASKNYIEGDPKIQFLQNRLMVIAQAETANSAHEAFDLGYLDKARDEITINKNRLIFEAKKRALAMVQGYHAPDKSKIKVLGRNALSFFYTAVSNMKYGHYISEYDQEIANKLAEVMCGGEVTGEIEVSEAYLMNLEKEVFMELVQNKKTLKRIEHLLKQGKPLRN